MNSNDSNDEDYKFVPAQLQTYAQIVIACTLILILIFKSMPDRHTVNIPEIKPNSYRYYPRTETKWEEYPGNYYDICRIKTNNGWLVVVAGSSYYVPDPDHKWKIDLQEPEKHENRTNR